MKRKLFEIPQNKHGGIYMLYNVNNHKVYIGETHNFRERATQHKYNLLSNRHSNKKLQNDFNSGNDFVFVILEDMGEFCNDKDLILRETLYMYAFLWKYVKLYNRQTINELKDKLFFCIVFPTEDKIHKDMRLLFHCEIASMFRCGTETLKNKFAEINMNDKKEDGR